MSKFFESENVKQEIEEITCLQKELYDVIIKFPMMSPQAKVEHIDTVKELLERQQIMWTRLTLSDDPEAVQVKDHILETAKMFGFNEMTGMDKFFQQLDETIKKVEEGLDF